MSTSRRQFLTTLAGLAAAPFVAARALAAAKPVHPPMRDGVDRSSQPDTPCAYAGRAIKVPSNRFMVTDNSVGGTVPPLPKGPFPLYMGDWDGTFKLEVCDNPAWMLADLITQTPSMHGCYWLPALYDWGCHCDELVVDPESYAGGGPAYAAPLWGPRYTVNTLVCPSRRMGCLRDTLSMHYRVWLATDPRYQRSFPGIPFRA